MASEADVQRVKEQHELELLELPGVQGVGIGDGDTGPVIKVYVDQATPEVKEGVPDELGGVQVVIEASGEFHAF